MFGIGFGEILVICVVVLLFFGPHKLPEVMKQVGKFYVFVRRQSNEMRDAFDRVVKEAESEMLEAEREKIKKLIESTSVVEGSVSQGAETNQMHAPSQDAEAHGKHQS